jgi:hypothetical protein
MAPITMQTTPEAYESVLANAGATLPCRDAVDQRIVESVRTGKVWGAGQKIIPPPMKGLAKNNIGSAGDGIITDPSQVGGYPNYQGEPFKDLGADGIPRWWKQKFHLDPNDPTLADKDLQGDGYTVMDKYLDGLDPTQKVDWSSPHSNQNTLTPGTFITSR